MVLVVPEGSAQRGLPPDALAPGVLVLPLERNGGGVVVELLQADIKLPDHAENQIREQRLSIRVEKAVESAADTVVLEQAQLLGFEAHQGRHALAGPLPQAAEGDVSHDQVAKQEAERALGRQQCPRVRLRQVLAKNLLEAEPLQDVIDKRKCPDHLAVEARSQ